MASIDQSIHALLFAEGGPIALKRLSKLIGIQENDLQPHLDVLTERLRGSGIMLVRSDTEVTLGIAPEAHEVVLKDQKDEEEKNIGDAGLEVLAILLYEGSSTRADIDYVRGVNSSSTIRTLLSRGLVERSGNPLDGREYVYKPTTELLAHLGVGNRTELPEYGIISTELKAFKDAQHAGDGEQQLSNND